MDKQIKRILDEIGQIYIDGFEERGNNGMILIGEIIKKIVEIERDKLIEQIEKELIQRVDKWTDFSNPQKFGIRWNIRDVLSKLKSNGDKNG